jgi:hypothetical protein
MRVPGAARYVAEFGLPAPAACPLSNRLADRLRSKTSDPLAPHDLPVGLNLILPQPFLPELKIPTPIRHRRSLSLMEKLLRVLTEKPKI